MKAHSLAECKFGQTVKGKVPGEHGEVEGFCCLRCGLTSVISSATRSSMSDSMVGTSLPEYYKNVSEKPRVGSQKVTYTGHHLLSSELLVAFLILHREDVVDSGVEFHALEPVASSKWGALLRDGKWLGRPSRSFGSKSTSEPGK